MLHHDLVDPPATVHVDPAAASLTSFGLVREDRPSPWVVDGHRHVRAQSARRANTAWSNL